MKLHTTPDLDTCELTYREHQVSSWGWHKPLETPEVPPGSRFDINNNFLTHILKSNLNVFFIGDSVGENLASFYEESHWSKGAKERRSEHVFKKNLHGNKQPIYWVNNLLAGRKKKTSSEWHNCICTDAENVEGEE